MTAHNPQYKAFTEHLSAKRLQMVGPLLPTPSDIEGPFYKDGAPFRDQMTELVSLVIEGSVLNTDGKPVSGAVLDVWHADKGGNYDQVGFSNRGVFRVSPGGNYCIRTIMPGDYKISDVGQPDEFRCAHIHVKVAAPGYKTLTTQLYFSNDPYNSVDHWFDPRRVVNSPRGFFVFVLSNKE